MTKIADYLASGQTLFFPGGMGTELQRRGFNTALPLWSASANDDAPKLVEQIHYEYLLAGADVATTNTFRTTPRTYKKIGDASKARASMKAACIAAKNAAAKITDRPVFVAGSYATLEDCYEVDLVPADDILEREHDEQAAWLAEEGVDFLLPETINTLREAKAMASAASKTGLPFFISFVVDDKGCLLDGTPLTQAVSETDLPGRLAVGINCRPIDTLNKSFDALAQCYAGPKLIYANGIGRPHDEQGWIFEENEDSINKYLTAAQGWLNMGAQIIGGCCGTTPAYIEALTALRREAMPQRAVR